MSYLTQKHVRLPDKTMDNFTAGDKPILPAIPQLKMIGRGTAFRASKDEVDPQGAWDPFLFLGYVESGNLRLGVENEIYELSGGQGYIIWPNEHQRNIDGLWHPSKCYWLLIDLKPSKRKKEPMFLGLQKKESDEFIRSLKHIRQRTFSVPHSVVKNFNFIIDSIEKPQNSLLDIQMRHHLIEILMTFIQADQNTDHPNYSVMVRETIRLMEDHLNTPLSLSQIIKKLGWSISYFKTVFKKEVGISPAEYYLRKRIAKSEIQLRHTNKTINTISLETGFSSDSYFIKAFKRFVGITPQTFRSNYLRKGERG